MGLLPTLDTLFKAILLPAIIALAIYLFAIYILYPLYAHRQRYAQYLPVSLSEESTSSRILGRTRGTINIILDPVRNTGVFGFAAGVRDALWDMTVRSISSRRGNARTERFDEFYGDEELEDGVLGREDGAGYQAGSERRLSRDLEAGFRDDSDSEDDRPQGGRVR